MVRLKNISNVGFGTYRVDINTRNHVDALNFALKKGCNVYDTASNYRNGASEKAIGKLINDNPKDEIFIISKAGYISAHIEQEVGNRLENFKNVVNVRDSFKYSLDPKFVSIQFEKSLMNIGRDYVDAYLIHNPEYLLQSGIIDKEMFNKILYDVFEFLEKQIENGKLRYYGISSNIIADPQHFSEELSLENIVGIAEQVKRDHHFKFVQFPYNVAEKSAKIYLKNNSSFLDNLKKNGLICIANRPFNVKHKNNYTNLLISDLGDYNEQEIANTIHEFKRKIDGILFARNIKGDSSQIPILKELYTNYSSFTNDRFVTLLWDRHIKGLVTEMSNNNISEELDTLMQSVRVGLVKTRQNNLAQQAKLVLKDLGREDLIDEENRAKTLVKEYQNEGIDIVLVGMRRVEYVDSIYG